MVKIKIENDERLNISSEPSSFIPMQKLEEIIRNPLMSDSIICKDEKDYEIFEPRMFEFGFASFPCVNVVSFLDNCS